MLFDEMVIADLKSPLFFKTERGQIYHLYTINFENFLRGNLFDGSQQKLLEYAWNHTVKRNRKFELGLYQTKANYADFFMFHTKNDRCYRLFMDYMAFEEKRNVIISTVTQMVTNMIERISK